MALGLVGKKIGMTRVFNEEGTSVPVTMVQVAPNRITQVKTLGQDGYSSVQVTFGTKKVSRLNLAQKGIFAKAGVEPGEGFLEFRLKGDTDLNLGDSLTVESFTEGQEVDVQGTSKGKGFAGVVKRWNFSTQDATHGNSLSHRAPGSIGQNQSPGKVFKGKKMAGHMGSRKCTVQSLVVVKIDAEKQILLIKGGIPGAANSNVIITPAEKASA